MINNSPKFLAFPKDFIWGVSTSAHQIEGGNKNDWTEWENSPARLADLKARGLDVKDYRSELAANSWALYEEDLNLVEELHCGAYRLGIEWSRIEPDLGVYNIEAIKHYQEILKSLKMRHIQVVLTLWHWTNPRWLSDIGGWSNKSTVDYFERYVEVCVKEFSDLVDFWVVLNEPMVHVSNGNLTGKFPPNKKNPYLAYKTQKHLILAQKIAYQQIHKQNSAAKVGFTTLCNFIEPANLNPVSHVLAKTFDYLWNWHFINKTRKHIDYIGLDYYFHDRITSLPPYRENKNEEVTDFGWEIYPRGIYKVIKKASRYQLPIYIMENGLADAKDIKRTQFIKDHLTYVHKALEEGMPVKGYFHWSLLDNFEWADGYWPQFGLYSVDRNTFLRTARPSAYVYGEICKNNGLWVM